MTWHEACAIGQFQDTAFAAHRLGNQERFCVRVVQAGRVELDEFHVSHAASGAPAHRDAVAGGSVRVGGVEINFTRAAGRQDGVVRGDGVDFIAQAVERVSAMAAVVPVTDFVAGDQVDGDVVFQQGDIGVCPRLGGEGFLHRHAGGISGVDDAPVAVSAFLRQVVAGVGAGIARERHALGDQPVERRSGVFDHMARGGRVAQSGSGGHGVLYVLGEGVFPREYRGDAALRLCARPFQQRFFGDDSDFSLVGELQCQRKSGKAAAYDQGIKLQHLGNLPVYS